MTHQSSIKFARHHGCLFVALGLMGVGCAVGAEGEEDDMPELSLAPNYQTLGTGGTGGDPDTNNTLHEGCLNDTGVMAALRLLGQGPITDANHNLPTMSSLPAGSSTVYGGGCRRELLKIVVECALSNSYSYLNASNMLVQVPADLAYDNGDTYFTLVGPKPRTYQGRIGLAPAWKTRALTEDEQEYVSACVMARTNYTGTTVDILVEGRAPIAHDADWRSIYTYAESTVWGNVFTPTPSMHVCHNPENGYCIESLKRICDVGNNCNFTNHGDCAGIRDASLCGGLFPPSYCNAWPNRISVFLKPSYLMTSCVESVTP